MEEVYVIKLKGLPLKDADAARKPSFIANDLSVEVTLGFAFFHIVLGFIAMIFGLIFLLAFNWEDEWRASVQGLGCGIIFVFTGCIGIWSSSQRKHHAAQAKDSIKIFLLASLLSILTASSFILLTAAGVTISANFDSSRSHILFHLTLCLVIELINSILSGLTSCKIIWPLKFNFFSRNWPTQSKVKKKVIVSTNIYARGLYDCHHNQSSGDNNSNFQRYLGPNCVVSVAPPPSSHIPHQTVNHNDQNNDDQHHTVLQELKDGLDLSSTPSPVPSSVSPPSSSSSSGYCAEDDVEEGSTVISTPTLHHSHHHHHLQTQDMNEEIRTGESKQHEMSVDETENEAKRIIMTSASSFSSDGYGSVDEIKRFAFS